MEKTNVEIFFETLENIFSIQKEEYENDSVIITVFKNNNKYNIYYGIEKNDITSSEERKIIFATEKDFLKSGHKKLIIPKTGVCLNNVSEEEFNQILFAFNIKYWTRLMTCKDFDKDANIKFQGYMYPVKMSFARNIIESKILKQHHEGVIENDKYEDNVDKDEIDKYQEKCYETDYNYYLNILNYMENFNILNPIKNSYIMALNTIYDLLKENKQEESDLETTNFIKASTLIKKRKKCPHGN